MLGWTRGSTFCEDTRSEVLKRVVIDGHCCRHVYDASTPAYLGPVTSTYTVRDAKWQSFSISALCCNVTRGGLIAYSFMLKYSLKESNLQTFISISRRCCDGHLIR